VVPTWRVKWRLRWAWSWNPVSTATEEVVAGQQHPAQAIERAMEPRIVDPRPIDGGPDQALAQLGRLEVQDPLAEPVAVGGPPVMDHVWGQHRHRPGTGAVLVTVEVVADGALVHDEHRPRVVGVRRVAVLHEAGVEHLADARQRRLPGPHVFRCRGPQHARRTYKTRSDGRR
jgi:hypothetical protein